MDNQSSSQNSKGSYNSYQDTNFIDLVQLLVTLRKSWKQCLLVIFCCTLFSFLLAAYLPKTYRVESILLPPEKSNIDLLIIPITENQSPDKALTKKDLYLHFLSNLEGNKLRKRFLAENSSALKIKKEYNKNGGKGGSLQKEFRGGLTVEYNKNANEGGYNPISVKLSGTSPVHLADLLNEYVVFVDGETVKSAVVSIRSRVKVAMQSVEDKISSLRAVAEENRRNTLDKIREDIGIAKKLQILDPIAFPTAPDTLERSGEAGLIENINEQPDYLKGSKALEAELEAMEKRKNNDPFIPGLLNLLQEEKYLNQLLKMKFDDIHASTIDKIATRSQKAVKPNKILFVLIGFSFGLLISIFIVLIKNIIARLQ